MKSKKRALFVALVVDVYGNLLIFESDLETVLADVLVAMDSEIADFEYLVRDGVFIGDKSDLKG